MFDIDHLLQPIREDQPCGDDLAFSPEVDAIARAREFDDPSLEQGEWATELKEADWGFVAARCTDLLATRSKDLRLAAWLAEASAKLRAFRGLGDAYALLAGLCDRYWDNLHPLPDEDDFEQRIGNLSWLLKRSVQLVREMPLTEARPVACSMADFESARVRSGDAEHAGPSLAEAEAARQKSSPAFCKALLEDARYCMASLCALEKALDARLGVDGPDFSAAKDALDSVIRFIAPMAERGVGSGEGGEEILGAAESGDEPLSSLHAGPIRSRAQALAQLRAVAAFFRRSEPHSPVAYLAEKAAAWGNLSLHDWLRQVVKDQGSLAHIEEILGVQQEGERQ